MVLKQLFISHFKIISQALSLEKAVELDHINAKRKKYNYSIPHASFNASLYRQPSLSEEEQQPEPYRTVAATQAHQQSVAARRSSIKADAGTMEAGRPSLPPAVGGRPTTIPEGELEEEDHRELEEEIEEVLGEKTENKLVNLF